MANLEKIEVLVPESHSISTRAVVLSNYSKTIQQNDNQETIRVTRSFDVSMGELGIMNFSQIIPNNPDVEKAIMGIHSGDTFRIAHRGVTPAKEGASSPSGMKRPNQRLVKGYFNSPIILWATFTKAEQGALYEGVVFPDLSDRNPVGERVVNFNKINSVSDAPETPVQKDDDIPY